jgi:hypothetical protein
MFVICSGRHPSDSGAVEMAVRTSAIVGVLLAHPPACPVGAARV